VLFVGAKSRSGLLLFGSRLGYSRLWRSTFTKDAWTTDRVPLPDHGMIIQGAADIHSDTAFVRYESFLQPPSLYSVDMAHNAVAPIVGAPADFRTDAFLVEEREAVSPDGVLVPYSLVRPRDFSFNGASSALVVGYGSRGGTQLPAYSAALGRLWLEQGGVYVLANIRGGQERGREWAVSGVGRQHTYEDMIAVTDDLVRRKVTAAKRIGFMGHSAGGLLGGVMLTQRPDLFGAVVLKAPVLDQFRMDQIALGQTAWEGEFGSPDIPQERAFLERTSPFQNLRAQTNFPKPLIITSTTDETVSPAQARTFAAKMESLGMPFLFYESSDGGHGLTSTPAQKNRLEALIYVYLARQLLDQRVASGRE
jgi:prolyl oligopeptidase